LVWRLAEVVCKSRNLLDIRGLRMGRQIAHLQVLDHPLSKDRHQNLHWEMKSVASRSGSMLSQSELLGNKERWFEAACDYLTQHDEKHCRRELSDYHATIGSEDRCKPQQLDAIATNLFRNAASKRRSLGPRRNELPRSGLVQ